MTWIKEIITEVKHVRDVQDHKQRFKRRFVIAVRLATACLSAVCIVSAPAQIAPAAKAATNALPAETESASTNTTTVESFDGSAMKFAQTCAGCHTYGGGKLTGPDLVVAATWPQSDLKTNIKRMEEKVGPLGEETVENLAVFLKDPKVRDRIRAAEAVIAQKYAAKMEPGSAAKGEELFMGTRPFKNRGMACAGCHSVNGHTDMLGPDLKGVHAKMGETALISAIQKASFKVMDAAFKNHPVTPQEALHLAKYFGTLKTDSQPQQAGFPVLGAGVALAAVSLAAVTFLYRRKANGQSLPLQRRRK